MSIYKLIFSDNLTSNSAQDFPTTGHYTPSYLGYKFNINGATCKFDIAAIGSNPTLQIRTAANGVGDGITITLDSSTKKYGQTTSNLLIPASTTIYTRFTDCHQLGDGWIDLDLYPEITVALPGITDDELTAMLGIYLGKEILPKELNYFKRNARKRIMNLYNLRSMEFSVDFDISVALGEYYSLSTYVDTNFKEPNTVFLLDDNDEISTEIKQDNDRRIFEKRRAENVANEVDSEPTHYNIFDDKIWFTPVTQTSTVRVLGYRFLADVDGSSTDYIYTHLPQALETFIQANAERVKVGGDIEKAITLEKLAKETLFEQLNAEDGKFYAGEISQRKG